MSTTALEKWLAAGDEDPADFPIASALREAISEHYDFDHGIDALAADIQKVRKSAPRSDMVRICDIVQFAVDKAGCHIPGFDASLPWREVKRSNSAAPPATKMDKAAAAAKREDD